MALQFLATMLLVDDIERSRRFYEDILGQEIEFDFGENVSFKAGFAIHLAKHFSNLASQPELNSIANISKTTELYFETSDLDKYYDKLKSKNIKFIHELIEQPWRQRGFRFYDPDGYIIEIGEPMQDVILRLSSDMSPSEIASATSMPLETVEIILNSNS